MMDDEGCVYCGDPATCWQLTDELGYEALCEECGPVDDPLVLMTPQTANSPRVDSLQEGRTRGLLLV
jgi:hypothetical protein